MRNQLASKHHEMRLKIQSCLRGMSMIMAGWKWTLLLLVIAVVVSAGNIIPFEEDDLVREKVRVRRLGEPDLKGILVRPRLPARYPVVIFLHGSGGNTAFDGPKLRTLASLGCAAISVDYDQRDTNAFFSQFEALHEFIARQKHLDSNSIGWIASSLGAQRSLQFLLRKDSWRPRAFVRLSGGMVQELENCSSNNPANAHLQGKWNFPVLLVHGEADGIFPVETARTVQAALSDFGAKVEASILPNQAHDFGQARGLIFRAAAEWEVRKLGPPDYAAKLDIPELAGPAVRALNQALLSAGANRSELYHALKNSPRGARRPLAIAITRLGDHDLAHLETEELSRLISPAKGQPRWSYLIYVLLGLAAAWLCMTTLRMLAMRGFAPRSRLQRIATTATALLFASALAICAIQLIVPRMPLSETSRQLTERFVIQPLEIADFRFLCEQSGVSKARASDILDHLHLGRLQRGAFYKHLPEAMFKKYVLDFSIGSTESREAGWRRPLWEHFMPRVRLLSDASQAAQLLVHSLREQISIEASAQNSGVSTSWITGRTDQPGFYEIAVAVFRSVGIAARINNLSRAAEYWDGTAWLPIPSPLVWQFPTQAQETRLISGTTDNNESSTKGTR